MKFKTNPEIFKRINSINPVPPNPEKFNISERLLLFEGFRRIYEINVKINHILHDEGHTPGTITRLIPEDILEKISHIISEGIKDKKFWPGTLGISMIYRYLIWEMFCENTFVRELYSMNPYHFFIRILERGVPISKIDGRYVEINPYESYIYSDLDSKKNYQETPYLVSTDDEYLDKINAFYAEHNVLPPWLEEDNKRGFVL